MTTYVRVRRKAIEANQAAGADLEPPLELLDGETGESRLCWGAEWSGPSRLVWDEGRARRRRPFGPAVRCWLEVEGEVCTSGSS